MFYADVALGAGASVPLDPDYDERAIYTVSGDIEIAEDVCRGQRIHPCSRAGTSACPIPLNCWALSGPIGQMRVDVVCLR